MCAKWFFMQGGGHSFPTTSPAQAPLPASSSRGSVAKATSVDSGKDLLSSDS